MRLFLEIVIFTILDYVSFELKYEAEENGLKGLVPPSKLFSHYQEKKHLELELRVPDISAGINIHYLQSQHYVVSYKVFTETGPIIKIYDSLAPGERMWRGRLKDLPTQLQLLYGNITNIEVICAQHQGYKASATANCGIFAIANTIMLIKGEDPCEFTLPKNMRLQLMDMLQKKVLRPFTTVRRAHPLSYTKERKYTQIKQNKNFTKENIFKEKSSKEPYYQTGLNENVSLKTLRVNLTKIEDDNSIFKDSTEKERVMKQMKEKDEEKENNR